MFLLTEGMVSMDTKMTPRESFDPRKIQRNTTLGAIGVGLLSFACVGLTFLCGIGLFALISVFESGNSARSIDWNGLGGMASLATLAFVVGGLTFALIDYVQNAVQRKRDDAETSFNIYCKVYDRLMNPRDLEARRWIISNLPTLDDMGKDEKKWLECVREKIYNVPPGWQGNRTPGQEYLKDVLNTFDFIGFVAKHYWNMENELVMWMSPSIAKVWERIQGYVENEAVLRNEEDYYQSAREFGKHCLQWRQEHFPKSNIIRQAT